MAGVFSPRRLEPLTALDEFVESCLCRDGRFGRLGREVLVVHVLLKHVDDVPVLVLFQRLEKDQCKPQQQAGAYFPSGVSQPPKGFYHLPWVPLRQSMPGYIKPGIEWLKPRLKARQARLEPHPGHRCPVKLHGGLLLEPNFLIPIIFSIISFLFSSKNLIFLTDFLFFCFNI